MNSWTGRKTFLMASTASGTAGTGTPPPAAATGGNGSGGTATGDAGAGGSSAGGGTSGQDWFSSLPAEEKGFIQTKGYKDLADAVRSHRNLESLLGAPKERLLKLPEKADDKAGWEAIYNRLGRPEKADGYDPKAFGEGTSDGDAKWLQETFHSLNLTKAQGETLAQKWAEKMKGMSAAMKEAGETAKNQQFEKLKQDWGADFAGKIDNVVNKMVLQIAGAESKDDPKYLELYEKGEKAFGVDGWAKFIDGVANKFGIKFDEAGFHRGDGTSGGGRITPEQAQLKLNRLKQDQEFIKRFANGDAAARQEMDDLHKVMYPGMVTH